MISLNLPQRQRKRRRRRRAFKWCWDFLTLRITKGPNTHALSLCVWVKWEKKRLRKEFLCSSRFLSFQGFFFLSPRKIFYFISNGPRAFSVHASTAALFRSQRPDRRSASSINHLFFLSSTTFLLNKSWWKVPAFSFYFILYFTWRAWSLFSFEKFLVNCHTVCVCVQLRLVNVSFFWNEGCYFFFLFSFFPYCVFVLLAAASSCGRQTLLSDTRRQPTQRWS